MRAAAIFFFARVSRAAIVGSETRNACAMSRRRDAAHEPQRQRDLRLARERRVAAGEDEPQAVVGDGVVVVGHRRRLGLEQQRQLRLQRAPRRSSVERVRRATVVSQAPGRAGTPSRAQARSARDVGVLHGLLGGVEVARDAHRRGEHEGPLAPVRVGDRLLDCASVVLHDLEAEQRPHLDAAVDDRRQLRQRERVVEVAGLEDEEPASTSLVSMNGPSVISAAADRRSPCPVGSSASPATIRPPCSAIRVRQRAVRRA